MNTIQQNACVVDCLLSYSQLCSLEVWEIMVFGDYKLKVLGKRIEFCSIFVCCKVHYFHYIALDIIVKTGLAPLHIHCAEIYCYLQIVLVYKQWYDAISNVYHFSPIFLTKWTKKKNDKTSCFTVFLSNLSSVKKLVFFSPSMLKARQKLIEIFLKIKIVLLSL